MQEPGKPWSMRNTSTCQRTLVVEHKQDPNNPFCQHRPRAPQGPETRKLPPLLVCFQIYPPEVALRWSSPVVACHACAHSPSCCASSVPPSRERSIAWDVNPCAEASLSSASALSGFVLTYEQKNVLRLCESEEPWSGDPNPGEQNGHAHEIVPAIKRDCCDPGPKCRDLLSTRTPL